jgi:tetratricopeptide (TPR) repeat protein
VLKAALIRVSESLMRLSPVALSLAILVASSSLVAQRPDDQLNPRSAALVEQAAKARAAGKLDEASGLLETALAVDPRNRTAYINLAEVSEQQGLPGKAIRLFGEALVLEPNDVRALGGQGEAMVQKGAVERAKANLAKVQGICKGSCPQEARLAAAIAKGPPAAVLAAQATDKVPPKGAEEPTVKP